MNIDELILFVLNKVNLNLLYYLIGNLTFVEQTSKDGHFSLFIVNINSHEFNCITDFLDKWLKWISLDYLFSIKWRQSI